VRGRPEAQEANIQQKGVRTDLQGVTYVVEVFFGAKHTLIP